MSRRTDLFKEAEGSLKTLRDVLRFAVSRFNEAGLFFGHGSDNAHDEAAYLILHTLHLPPDNLTPYLDAALTDSEKKTAACNSGTPYQRANPRRLPDPPGLAGRI